MRLRDATPADAASIAAIYAPHVLQGTATAEEIPPEVPEIAARMARVIDAGLPWLVAEQNGEAVAYAYLAPYHSRAAYRLTVEDSIYVDPAAQGRGLGRALLTELIARADAVRLAQMIASITAQGGEASMALHARAGFAHVGRKDAIIRKHGRWLDVVYMQRALAAASHITD